MNIFHIERILRSKIVTPNLDVSNQRKIFYKNLKPKSKYFYKTVTSNFIKKKNIDSKLYLDH